MSSHSMTVKQSITFCQRKIALKPQQGKKTEWLDDRLLIISDHFHQFQNVFTRKGTKYWRFFFVSLYNCKSLPCGITFNETNQWKLRVNLTTVKEVKEPRRVAVRVNNSHCVGTVTIGLKHLTSWFCPDDMSNQIRFVCKRSTGLNIRGDRSYGSGLNIAKISANRVCGVLAAPFYRFI